MKKVLAYKTAWSDVKFGEANTSDKDASDATKATTSEVEEMRAPKVEEVHAS